jgi:mannose-6-phosphate isomerase
MTDRDVLQEAPEAYEEKRPWGAFLRLVANERCTVKMITVQPGEELSLQSHERRSELWLFLDPGGIAVIDGETLHPAVGETVFIPVGSKHRLAAAKDATSDVRIVEVGFGDFDEGDIIRYEDRYGRS